MSALQLFTDLDRSRRNARRTGTELGFSVVCHTNYLYCISDMHYNEHVSQRQHLDVLELVSLIKVGTVRGR